MCTYIIFFRYFFSCGHHKLSNLRKWFKKTHRRWYVCAHQNYHKACTVTQTFNAILYRNKCIRVRVLNFSPKCPIGGSTKGGILNGVFLAIFVAIFLRFLAHPVASITKSRLFLDGLCCGPGQVFCRYCIAFHWRCICFQVLFVCSFVCHALAVQLFMQAIFAIY